MDRSLYIAMSGAKEMLYAQGLVANNLANVNTDGFRADFEQARSMPVFGPGAPTRVYSMTERPGTDFSPGAIQTTGRSLDVAIRSDDGWIAVQAADGSEAYTRAGDLQTTVDGLLVTGSGLPVLSDNGPIQLPPSDRIEIGQDGTVSVIAAGDNALGLAAVAQIKLVKPPREQLQKGLDGLMRLPGGATADADASVQLVSGAKEGSNVNPIESMVRMIDLQRNFELQIRMMKTIQDTEQSGSDIMRLA